MGAVVVPDTREAAAGHARVGMVAESRLSRWEDHGAQRTECDDRGGDRAESASGSVADRAPTEDQERAADESRERYVDGAESVAEARALTNETGANAEGDGRTAQGVSRCARSASLS